MSEEKAAAQNITLYPSQVQKVERFMRFWKIRKFSAGIQRLIEEMPELALDGAEKSDTNGGASAAGNIGA